MKTITISLEDRLIEFASGCIEFIEAQPQRLAVKMLAGQLVRSSSNSALHYAEVLNARNGTDHCEHHHVCLNALRESGITLRILERRSYIHSSIVRQLIDENEKLIRIFSAGLFAPKAVLKPAGS